MSYLDTLAFQVIKSLDDAVRFLHEEIVLMFMPHDSLAGVVVTSFVAASVLAICATLACLPCIHLFGEYMEARIRKRRDAKMKAVQKDAQLSNQDISAVMPRRQQRCMCAQDLAERMCCVKACSGCLSVFCGALCAPCKALGGAASRGKTAPAEVIALRVREAKLAPSTASCSSGAQPLLRPSVACSDGITDQSDTGPTQAGPQPAAVWRRCTVPPRPTLQQLHDALIAKLRPRAPRGAARVHKVLSHPDNVLLESNDDCAVLKNGDSLIVRFEKPGQERPKDK